MNQKHSKETAVPSASWETATGKLDYTLTNDYLFRAVLQENNKVLRGLICSLLRIPPQDVASVQIVNPIELGKSVADKTFILDIRILLNNNTLINLEMQVLNEKDWTDRSLSYLCRSYDRLSHGQGYDETKNCIHIGILDFTLFDAYPEFYAEYKLMNVKKHYIYNDKFTLNVLCLTQIELATEEDKAFGLDLWAALFKSGTWEDIKMLAQKDENMMEAVKTVYQMTADERIREQCEAREEYNLRMRRINQEREKLNAQISELTKENASLTGEITSLAGENASLTNENASLTDEVASLRARIAELEGKG